MTAGGESFEEEAAGLFVAARSGGAIPLAMDRVDFYSVPCRGMSDVSGEKMIEYAKEAAEYGTLAVYVFHGVGGGHNLNVTREAHARLLDFLSANRQNYWTDTFLNVMKYTRQQLSEEK